MAKGKKMVEEITSMEEDFTQWFTDIVKKADLIDYSSVRGCMIFRPYGYGIWENIQQYLDKKLKETGHENVYMPMFIPESLLQKEKDHIEGFAPEVAWVTKGGNEELEEPLCVRPTSETLFCQHYANILNSYRELPLLYNQWCSVVRWEKTSRPFLRNVEFLWQEGHTLHETEEEAMEETLQMLNIYQDLAEKVLCMPVISGEKTQKEKFSGAQKTYTIEAMMHDGKGLQSGTSHYFGTDFAKAFDITFAGRDNKMTTPHQTSWGISTRLIGGIIMTHGDDNGLVLPPQIAPIQVVFVPVAQHKPGVLDKVYEIEKELKKRYRTKVDASDNSPGWKFAQYEMKGVPIRIELGPRDIEGESCILVRRDLGEKQVVALKDLEKTIELELEKMEKNLYTKAKENREKRTTFAKTLEEMKTQTEKQEGFIQGYWCEALSCEERVKEEGGLTSRCIPFEGQGGKGNCVSCGKESETLVYWGKSY